MKKTQELLQLIEDGNAIEILCKDNLIDELNTLHEQELIEIKESTVVLTEKGKEAKAKGFLPMRQTHTKMVCGAGKPEPLKTGHYWIYFGLFLLLVLLFLGALLTLI